MQTKYCLKCKNIYDISFFSVDTHKKDNHCTYCKKCVNKQAEIYRNKNKDNINIKIYQKQYREKNSKKLKCYIKDYMVKNKEYRKIYDKQHYLKNRQKTLEYQRNYVINNKVQISIKDKLYRINNKEKLNKYHRKYTNNRRKTDINFKLLLSLRQRLRVCLLNSNTKRSQKTIDLLGCTINQFKEHLESKFQHGMSWNNYGFYGWHIDHIIPCSVFDLSDPVEQKQCFHYTNMQPLWAEDNLKKSDNY